MNGKSVAVLVMALMLMLAAATGVSAGEQDGSCPICDLDMSSYSGPLDEDEVGGLLLALNDEYLAWSIYDQVVADHGAVRPFTNIRRAEARHIAALEELFDTYELPVPANPWPGNVPSFDTVTDACAAGVAAEIANRDLYTDLFDTTEREDILTVYRSLQRASEENHLPAFERCSSGDGQGGNNGRGRSGGGQREPGSGQRGPGNGQCEPGSGQGEPGSGQREPGSGRSGNRP